MSGIYFHSESDDDVRVRGAERHMAGAISSRLLKALLDADSYYHKPRLIAAIRPVGSFKDSNYPDALSLRMSVDGVDLELKDGRIINSFSLSLNTMLRIGSRPLKLMARLHGQCEIHAWVDGPNRNWLADIIEEGLRDGVMRKDMQWEAAVELLRKRNDGPIVTSYSVCEQFPSTGLIDPSLLPRGEDGEIDYDAACEMENKWDLAMAALREKDGGLELKPEDFDTYYFGGANVSCLDIYDHLPEKEPDADTSELLRRFGR